MKLQNPWIKLTGSLNQDDANRIAALEAACARTDQVAFKLELPYKLGVAAGAELSEKAPDTNELMYFDGERLIGYIGIGCFGGHGSPPELMGMVDPEYRGQGVFSVLHSLAISDLKRRGCDKALLLSDGSSVSGLRFIQKIGAARDHSEYEMYLKRAGESRDNLVSGIKLRKASNADAKEVARQNAIYFGDEHVDDAEGARVLLLPEEEEKRGMTIFLAERCGQAVGKVHLQLIDGLGGIYGLGVLPEHRKKGLGRAILTMAVQWLKGAGAQEVMLQVVTDNLNALRLYESCGFETTSVMEYYGLPLYRCDVCP